MMFSFMLVNDKNPLRICKHCNTVFKASRPSAVFCSPQCKNRYNVYKSRKKDKKQDIYCGHLEHFKPHKTYTFKA